MIDLVFTFSLCLFLDMFPTAKRKPGPARSPTPFKKRKLSTSKGFAGNKRPQSSGKTSFGAKNPAGKTFGGKKKSTIGVGGKGFRASKVGAAKSKFGKSKGETKFGRNKAGKFGEKKNDKHHSKGKGQRPKPGSTFKAGPKGGKAKRNFKK